MKQPDLISIGEASQILGVNEATLRQWTDEGKLKAFITPGGHRSYSRSDLKKLTGSHQKALSINDLVVELEDTTSRHREIGRSFINHVSPGNRPDEERQKQLAVLGRQMLNLTARYIREPANRRQILDAAREVGAGFGMILAEMGLPLTASVEAFLKHRDPIIQAAANLAGKREVVSGRIVEAIPLANHLMDETLVSMIAAHIGFQAESETGRPS